MKKGLIMGVILVSLVALAIIGFSIYFQSVNRCIDYNPGKDIYTKGTIRGYYEVSGTMENASDSCIDENTLLEYFCGPSKEIKCHCINGACVKDFTSEKISCINNVNASNPTCFIEQINGKPIPQDPWNYSEATFSCSGNCSFIFWGNKMDTFTVVVAECNKEFNFTLDGKDKFVNC